MILKPSPLVLSTSVYGLIELQIYLYISRNTTCCQKWLPLSLSQDAPIAWVNLNVFDYAGELVTGKYTLYTWPFGDEYEVPDLVNYIGPAVLNPNHSGCLQLTVEILPNPQVAGPILFPSSMEVENFARQMAEGATRSVS